MSYTVNFNRILEKPAHFNPKHTSIKNAAINFNNKKCTKIPYIEYTQENLEVFNRLAVELNPLQNDLACSYYSENKHKIININPKGVPQLNDVDELVYSITGWNLIPVAGTLHPRELFAGFACKKFPCTQFVRDISNIYFSYEADYYHDLYGHVPILMNQEVCEVLEIIGKISIQNLPLLRRRQLLNIYQRIFEYGAIIENKKCVAIGAATLTSKAELTNFHNYINTKKNVNLDAFDFIDTPIEDAKVQDFYVIQASLKELTQKLSSRF